MRQISYSSDVVQSFLNSHLVASMDQLKDVLGTSATSTILRRLVELDYLSSFSHRGSFYTLRSIAEFDKLGLWHHEEASFSRHGNLIDTCHALVSTSQNGFSVAELDEIVAVETKRPLRQLYRDEKIARSKLDGVFVYFSRELNRRRQQQQMRSDIAEKKAVATASASAGSRSDEVKAAIILFFSALNEKQRRLFAGLESLKHGHGGDRFIAGLLHLDPHTVAKGRRELIDQDVNLDNVRKKGGGRKSVEKKRRKSSMK